MLKEGDIEKIEDVLQYDTILISKGLKLQTRKMINEVRISTQKAKVSHKQENTKEKIR